MQRIREGLKTRFRSLVTQRTGLDEMAVDDLATSTKLQSWEAVQIPERLRFSSRLAILLVGFFMLIVAFVPWPQTITVTGQLSAYTPLSAHRMSKPRSPAASGNGTFSKACG